MIIISDKNFDIDYDIEYFDYNLNNWFKWTDGKKDYELTLLLLGSIKGMKHNCEKKYRIVKRISGYSVMYEDKI